MSRSGAIIEDMPDRNVLYTAQAPQSFILSDVYDAHISEQKKTDPYTRVVDTASLMKKHGMELYIVAGPRGNIKVTTPEDLYIFRAMLEYKQTEHVFGFGAREVRYLQKYPWIKAMNMHPLQYYIVYGAQEDTSPNPYFDAIWYQQQYSEAINNKTAFA